LVFEIYPSNHSGQQNDLFIALFLELSALKDRFRSRRILKETKTSPHARYVTKKIKK